MSIGSESMPKANDKGESGGLFRRPIDLPGGVYGRNFPLLGLLIFSLGLLLCAGAGMVFQVLPLPEREVTSDELTGVASLCMTQGTEAACETAEAAGFVTPTLLPTTTSRPQTSETPATLASNTPTPSPTDTAMPPSPTPTPARPTVTSSPSPTPDPLARFYIETLQERSYGDAGEITVGTVLAETDAYTRYSISYPSDDLTISGYMNVPNGDGPFPVIVLNHGYYDPGIYQTGFGTLDAADFLARRDYLTVASDYRTYAGSDDGENDFRVGYVIDVLNLVALLDTLPQADTERIGMWGHSMGGGISINAMVISDQLDAVVLYGPMSGDMADNWRHIHQMWNRPEMERLAAEYGGPDERPDAYRKMSAIEHLDEADAPVQIHHGTSDEQVPYQWSVRLRDELEAAGKEVTLFTYEGVRHSFQGEAWSTFMQRVLEFYDEHVQ